LFQKPIPRTIQFVPEAPKQDRGVVSIKSRFPCEVSNWNLLKLIRVNENWRIIEFCPDVKCQENLEAVLVHFVQKLVVGDVVCGIPSINADCIHAHLFNQREIPFPNVGIFRDKVIAKRRKLGALSNRHGRITQAFDVKRSSVDVQLHSLELHTSRSWRKHRPT